MVICPKCSHEFEPKLECLRCGHGWLQRGAREPKVCPNPGCKSPYWNRMRKKAF